MFRGQGLLSFIPRTGWAGFRSCRCGRKRGITPALWQSTGISMTPRPEWKSCLMTGNLKKSLPQRASSFLRQIPSISAVWFPRWFTMSMPMQSFWQMKRFPQEKPSMWLFLPETLEIFLLPILPRGWGFRLES